MYAYLHYLQEVEIAAFEQSAFSNSYVFLGFDFFSSPCTSKERLLSHLNVHNMQGSTNPLICSSVISESQGG
jgi:hypothetical protein